MTRMHPLFAGTATVLFLGTTGLLCSTTITKASGGEVQAGPVDGQPPEKAKEAIDKANKASQGNSELAPQLLDDPTRHEMVRKAKAKEAIDKAFKQFDASFQLAPQLLDDPRQREKIRKAKEALDNAFKQFDASFQLAPQLLDDPRQREKIRKAKEAHDKAAPARPRLGDGSLGAEEPGKSAAQRGALAVRGQPAMSPPTWSQRAFGDVWKQWGLKEKPADFDARLRERYGLLEAPYENAGLPMGLHRAQGPFGKGVINDCLLCHAGAVAGKTIIGLGNSALDLQTMFDDLAAQSKLPIKVPVQLAYVRGTIDPVNPVTFLMSFRDLDLNLTGNDFKLDYSKDIVSDPPAWWLLKRKTTRNWTGSVGVNSMRVDMVNLLTPLNSPENIKKHEATFADIHAFIMTIEAPRYPFAVDTPLAEKGRVLFNENCARCHGTYGAGGKYPNKIVPLDMIGTDPALARSITKNNVELFNKTWFAKEKSADGGWYKVGEIAGYQAPPLDGVWATAPYFHNASVPTVYHVLNSKARPKIFTRSFGSGKEDYDAERLGLKITALGRGPDAKTPAYERRKTYDTTLPGQGNAGHTFGDDLTEEERRAVIEYLKTL